MRRENPRVSSLNRRTVLKSNTVIETGECPHTEFVCVIAMVSHRD